MEASTNNGLKIVYSINSVGKIGQFMQQNETRPPSYTTHKINSKWIKDLSVRPKTTKITEENIGSKISDIAHRNFFLSDVSSQARETKEKNKQMGLHRTKRFLHSNGNHNKTKRQPTDEMIY